MAAAKKLEKYATDGAVSQPCALYRVFSSGSYVYKVLYVRKGYIIQVLLYFKFSGLTSNCFVYINVKIKYYNSFTLFW